MAQGVPQVKKQWFLDKKKPTKTRRRVFAE